MYLKLNLYHDSIVDTVELTVSKIDNEHNKIYLDLNRHKNNIKIVATKGQSIQLKISGTMIFSSNEVEIINKLKKLSYLENFKYKIIQD